MLPSVKEISTVANKEVSLADFTDGVSMKFPGWRLNLCNLNTEPPLRLSVEAQGNSVLVADRVAEIEAIISEVV